MIKLDEIEAKAKCELCGEPMPAGEEMFLYHGMSGDCPKPTLKREDPIGVLPRLEALEKENARLREALEYYACPDHYESFQTLGGMRGPGVLVELGQKARQALKGGGE